MRKSLITTTGVALMALTLSATPASARHYYADGHGRYYYTDSHHHRHYRNCKAAGTVVGVVTGAVLGNAITHHSGAGTIIGAGVGGLAGNRIAASNCHR